MEVFKCCKTCFHVLVEDDHRYSICTKPALDYKSIDLLIPNAKQVSHQQNCQTTLAPTVFLPQPWSYIASKIQTCWVRSSQTHSAPHWTAWFYWSNRALRVQAWGERHVARLIPLLASVRRCGAQSKLSISVNLSLVSKDCHSSGFSLIHKTHKLNNKRIKHIKQVICLENSALLLLLFSDNQQTHMDLAEWEVIYNKHKWWLV